MKSTKLIFAGALMTVLMITTSYASVKNNYSNTYVAVEEKARGLVNKHLLPALVVEEVAVPQPEKAPESNNRYTPQQMAAIVGLWETGENTVKAAAPEAAKPVVAGAVDTLYPTLEEPKAEPVVKTYSPEQFVSVLEIKF